MPELGIEEILRKLQAKSTKRGWRACCPAHNDKKPSLSITESGGKILFKCFAGCPIEKICAAAGIAMKDLFIEENSLNPKRNGHKNNIVAEYDYTDENGKLLYQSVRLEPKDFRQRRPDDKGGWIWNLRNTSKVLYRLPEVIDSQLVYVVEGEKDADTLKSKGLVATCCPMGAGKWRKDYNESLRGKTVIILPDNDEPGREHAAQVANSLYGIADEVLIVNLPDLPEKGDVTDYFENGGTVDDLMSLVGRAESWKPVETESKAQSQTGFNFRPLTELLNEPDEETSFVWDKTLPTGGFSIMSAKPKVGKSTLARNLAVCVVSGEPFLERGTTKGKVLYCCLEEKRSEVIRHFRAMGFSSDEILIHTGATPKNVLEELAIAISEFEPILVIIDPLSRVLRVRDFNDYGGMARGLEPLIDLARRINVHILALHHDSKLDRSGGDALLGSTAIFGAVDCHIQLKKREQSRTILTTQRYGDDMPETVIELNKETGIVSSRGDLQEVTLNITGDRILEIINNGEELRESQIKERIEGFSSQGVISQALRKLVGEGKLLRKGQGKKGNPYLYKKSFEPEF